MKKEKLIYQYLNESPLLEEPLCSITKFGQFAHDSGGQIHYATTVQQKLSTK